MIAKYELEKYLQPDTYLRLDFSDDGPAWSMWLEDGTYVSIFSATPETTFTSHRPTFQAVIVHNLRPNGEEDWQVGTFESPHPGSYDTTEQQQEGFFGPLHASLVPVSADQIDQALNLRYFEWKDQQGEF